MRLSDFEGDEQQPAGNSEFPVVSWDENKMERLEQLFSRAMAEGMTRNRPLKYWENLKLKPKHLQIILMKAAGYTNNLIAQQLDLTPARVSVIVNHPDAQSLLSTLVSYAAEDVLDIKTRIKAHAGEALDVALDVMRTTKDDAVRARTGFELLKMAGYGAVEKKEVKRVVEIREEQSGRLADAMEDLLGLQSIDVEAFVELSEPPLLSGSEAGDLQQVDDAPTVADEPPVSDSPRREVA